jgi:hypothetical protein
MGKRSRFMVAVSSAVVLFAGGVSITTASATTDASHQADRSVIAHAGSEVRAKVTAKVPVSVVMSPNGREIDVEIDWHDGLDARPGPNRFVVRVMAGNQEIAQRIWTESRPDVHTFTINLNPAKTKALRQARNAGVALVAVTQQSDTNKDTDKLFERNYVTIVDIPAPNRPMVRAGTLNCSNISIQPGADLSNCNLTGANLAFADLTNANLSGADLAFANLAFANLSNADLAFANLAFANLSNANLSGANLSGANLSGANLSYAFLFGAICPSGAMASGDPATC